MQNWLSRLKTILFDRSSPKISTASSDTELMERFSHEMRTLLTGIVGYSEYIEKNSVEPMVNFTAKIIRESSLGLTRASNAIFDLHQLSYGKIRLQSTLFSFSELVRSIVRNYHKQALENDVNLIFTCSDDVFLLEMSSDVERVKQVVDSLINWALQSVEKEQSIHIDASLENENSIKLMLIFIDSSTSGVEVDLLERFWNSEFYKFKLQEGPGIELACAKAMIYLLNGCAEYRSSLDELPRLIVKLPVRYEIPREQK